MDFEVKDPVEMSGYPQERILHLYPDERTNIDIVGEDGYFERMAEQFGKRCMRGTALGFCPNPEKSKVISQNFEPFLRRVFGQLKPQRAVEIGTLYGVTTALLAHYSRQVITIDVAYQQIASYLWCYFGVQPKIKYVVVKSNEDKRELCGQLYDKHGFDFAFIDGHHSYDDVEIDFECVKKCGRVLFHDYGLRNQPGVTDFVNELPNDEIWVYRPFAYWQRRQ